MRFGVSARDVSVFAAAVAVGLLHRSAVNRVWADDRPLAAEPDWFQLAAPQWHASLPHSSSVAQSLTRLVDPLTDASTTGDERALAAVLTAVAAAALVLLLRRFDVPRPLAVLLALGLAGAVLPVGVTTSVALALQTLVAAALLLVWCQQPFAGAGRTSMLAVLTVVGAANHVSALPFAAGLWATEVATARGRARVTSAAAALATGIVGLPIASWMLHRDVIVNGNAAVPSTLDLANALVTGRFAAGLQPQAGGSIGQALALGVPGPLLLCLTLAALAWAVVPARIVVSGLAVASGAVLLFAGTTWLPDPAVAVAPAQLGLLVLAGLGTRWLWAARDRAHRTLAAAAAVVIGLSPSLVPERANLAAAAAELRAYGDSATRHVGNSRWLVSHLTTARELLRRHDTPLPAGRVAVGDTALGLPDDERVVFLVDAEAGRVGARWIVPQELEYLTADDFVAAHQDHQWLALAHSGTVRGDFCQRLIQRFHPAEPPLTENVAVLAHAGRHASGIAAEGMIEAHESERLIPGGSRVPAHFRVDAARPAIDVNGEATSAPPGGTVITVFDPTLAKSRSWVLDDCGTSPRPTIANRRLRAAYVLEAPADGPAPSLPVVSLSPVTVPLGDAGNGWLTIGWHGPEGAGTDARRWTGAHTADVPLMLSHRQAVRVRLRAQLAQRPSVINSLSLEWNGQTLASPVAGPFVDGEWMVPKALVRRGANVLSLRVADLVSPASFGSPGDARLLGAQVRRLVIEPTPSAASSSAATR
jgi:hypothetical protein